MKTKTDIKNIITKHLGNIGNNPSVNKSFDIAAENVVELINDMILNMHEDIIEVIEVPINIHNRTDINEAISKISNEIIDNLLIK